MSGAGTSSTRTAALSHVADRPMIAAAPFLVALVVVHLLTWQATSHLELRPDTLRLPFAGDWFWGGWNLWDGQWYVQIARDGYSYTPGEQSTVAFFPAYPLVGRVVGWAMDNVTLGLMVTTAVSGIAAYLCFGRWCSSRMPGKATLAALCLLAVFPYAFYLYGAIYSDALFLLLALAAFLLADRGHNVPAVAAAAAASATRLVGVGVAIGIAAVALERAEALRWGDQRPRLDRDALRLRHLGLLLSFVGIVAWGGYLWVRFDDPFAFATVQNAWGQAAGPRTWFKVQLFADLFSGDDLRYSFGCVAQGVGAIAALFSVPAVSRRFGASYGIYVFVIIAIPVVGSQDFQGLGRYLLAAFPLFALVGERLVASPPVFRRVAIVSGILMLFNAVLFVKGDYVA